MGTMTPVDHLRRAAQELMWALPDDAILEALEELLRIYSHQQDQAEQGKAMQNNGGGQRP